MGQVVKTGRFWRSVPKTENLDAEPIVISRTSLDTLTATVELARNRVVHCQCELAKAENAFQEAQAAWADAVLERGSELGIAEFCKITANRRRRNDDD